MIALLRTLILARLLAPEDFGLVAIGLVVVEVSMSLTNFGVREALVQAHDPDEHYYDTAWTYEIVRAFVVAGLLVLGAPLIADIFFREPRATSFLRWLALIPLLDHAMNIRTARLARSLRFRPEAIISLTGVVVHTAVSLTLARSLGARALVAGVLIGGVAQVATSYVLVPGRMRLSFDREASRALFHFGRWIFVMESVWVVSRAVVHAVISLKLGVEVLGIFVLATRLAFLPRELVKGAAHRVVFAVQSRLQQDRPRAVRTLRATVLGTAALLVPAYAVILVLAPDLVGRFAGARWIEAIPVIRFLVVVGMMGVATDAALPLLQARGRTGRMAALFGVRSAVLVAAVWALAGAAGLRGVAAGWVVAESVAAVCAAVMVRRLLPGALAGLEGSLSIVLGTGAAAALAALLVDRTVPGLAGLLAAGLVGVGVAVTLLATMRRHLDLEGLAGPLEAARSPEPAQSRSRRADSTVVDVTTPAAEDGVSR